MIKRQSETYDKTSNSDGYKPPLMLSPVETAERFNLPQHFVRELAANGSVVSIRAGRRILINAESVERYLTTGEAQGAVTAAENVPAPSGGRIVPIPLKEGVAGGL